MNKNKTAVNQQSTEQLEKELNFHTSDAVLFVSINMIFLAVLSTSSILLYNGVILPLLFPFIRENMAFLPQIIQVLRKILVFGAGSALMLRKCLRMQQAHAELNRRRSSDSK